MSKIIINKFRGSCCQCGKSVQPFEGIAFKEGDSPWQTAHLDCEPALAAPVLREREEQRQAYRKQEVERAAAVAAAKACRDAMLLKTGLDLKSEVVTKSEQHSYSDYFESYFLFSGEATIEDMRFLLETPGQSSYGKLRWSNGRHVVKVEDGKVFVTESVSICD